MPQRGKHRRPRVLPRLGRRAGLTTGLTLALALPLLGAGAGTAAAAGSTSTYRVAAGDTLGAIAAAHGIAGGRQGLYAANRAVIGSDPDLIRPGLVLTLPAEAAATPAATTAADSRASRSAARATLYPNTLDGWIRESLAIMAQHGIPGSYEGIHRNVLRESSGNPLAINNWDSNAVAGTPSKGLLQVIDPTFRAYRVPGTAADPYDPVANITAACNYAAARYGSIDNVFGAY
ncbi:transglycosylase SLT domain-containing protein [Streptomyces sp. BI20]|uniref:transglycosylase SLT domain-containing protein n=1 Tax=Streptomyces sp. BI20 TaxID=3403460 RepID=UPI003C74BE56